MNILGITNNDLSGAALISDGKIVSALSEERVNKIKDFNGWPHHSLRHVLADNSLNTTNIDHVCYGWSTGFNAERNLALYLERYELACARGGNEPILFRERLSAEMKNDLLRRTEFEAWVREHDLLPRVRYVDHHEAHAIGAFALSPFSSGLAISCDGRGDFRSMSVYRVERGSIENLYSQTTMDSFGYLYGRITRALGFIPNRHEGKVLGIAAHGRPSGFLSELRKIVEFRDGKITFQLGGIYAPFYDRHIDALDELCGRYSREDIAYAMQDVLVSTVAQLVAHFVRLTGLSNVAVGGGVFTNVRLNQALAELPEVSNLFVLPCMGDGGLPLSAAAAFAYTSGASRPKLETMALGTGADADDSLESMIRYDIPNELVATDFDSSTTIEALLDVLTKGGVVGLYRGRCEFGPRALCRRSLLALPSIVGISAELNRRLHRSDFMPFAPVVAANLAESSFRGWSPRELNSRYMTRTFDCTREFQASCPEVVHVDGTARPQVVEERDDPFVFRLLNELHARTGSMALINTSFNAHESPIIGHIHQAVDAMREGICDLLLIDDKYVLAHRAETERSARRLIVA